MPTLVHYVGDDAENKLWDIATTPLAEGETTIPFNDYKDVFMKEEPFLIRTPLRELLSPEDSKLLWALVGRKDGDPESVLSKQFEVALFYKGPDNFRTACISLLTQRFNQSEEDQESIVRQVENAITLCIVDNQEDDKKAIGALNFCHSMEGIWVNWLSTSYETFIKRNWGGCGDGALFEKRGIGSFLLGKVWDLIEIAALRNDNIEKKIYLQSLGPKEVKEGTPYKFYMGRGFDAVENNPKSDGFEKLPKSLQTSIKRGVEVGSHSFVFAPKSRNKKTPDCHCLLVCETRPVPSNRKVRPRVLPINTTVVVSPAKSGVRFSSRSNRSPGRASSGIDDGSQSIINKFLKNSEKARSKNANKIWEQIKWKPKKEKHLIPEVAKVEVISAVHSGKLGQIQVLDQIADSVVSSTKIAQVFSFMPINNRTFQTWLLPSNHQPQLPTVNLHQVKSITGHEYILGDMIRFNISFLFRSFDKTKVPFFIFDCDWYKNYIYNSDPLPSESEKKDPLYFWGKIAKKNATPNYFGLYLGTWQRTTIGICSYFSTHFEMTLMKVTQ